MQRPHADLIGWSMLTTSRGYDRKEPVFLGCFRAPTFFVALGRRLTAAPDKSPTADGP